jgi:hypothetical protein
MPKRAIKIRNQAKRHGTEVVCEQDREGQWQPATHSTLKLKSRIRIRKKDQEKAEARRAASALRSARRFA